MALSTETEVTSGVRGNSAQVVPTGAALGATVKGVDLKDLDDVAFARIMQAWHDRRDAFDPNSRRIMHRTQVKGDARPV